MAFGDAAAPDFNYFLQRKYALLQQQADAGSVSAASGAIQANAQAGALKAEAGLTNVRTQLAPAESASQIGLQSAQRALLGEQAKVVGPESAARIGQIGAETQFTRDQNRNFVRVNLTGINGGAPGSPTIGGLLGPGGYQGFRLGQGIGVPSGPLPRRLAGETEVQYQDRINGL